MLIPAGECQLEAWSMSRSTSRAGSPIASTLGRWVWRVRYGIKTVEDADCDGATAIRALLWWRCSRLNAPVRERRTRFFVEEGCDASAGNHEQAGAAGLRFTLRNIGSVNGGSKRTIGGRCAAEGGPAVVHR